MSAVTNTYSRFRANILHFHAWRVEQSVVRNVLLAAAWAALMGLLAQVRVPLPFTPVPFTMQVFGVFLGAILLGTAYGALAQALYVGAGVAGIPWFQGLNGGLAYFLGPTGGYLLAYPLAAFLVAFAVRRLGVRSFAGLTTAMVVGLAAIYGLGVAGLMLALEVSLPKAFLLGVAPFVAVDVGKAVLAAGLAKPFLPARANA